MLLSLYWIVFKRKCLFCFVFYEGTTKEHEMPLRLIRQGSVLSLLGAQCPVDVHQNASPLCGLLEELHGDTATCRLL